MELIIYRNQLKRKFNQENKSYRNEINERILMCVCHFDVDLDISNSINLYAHCVVNLIRFECIKVV